MAVYHEVLSTTNDEYVVQLYRQPRWRRWIALGYHHVWERLTSRLLRRVERWFQRRHQHKCVIGCVEGVRSDGTVDRMCGYMILTARQDCRCFELTRAGVKDHDWIDLPCSPNTLRVLGIATPLSRISRASTG